MAENSQPNRFDVVRAMNVPLDQKLEVYAEKLSIENPSISMIYDKLISRLNCASAGSDAPTPGSELIHFILPDSEGGLVSSRDLLDKGPLVVSFNRGHWCSFCRLELLALSKIHNEVEELGATLVSITPDGSQSIEPFRKEFNIPFAMVTDLDSGYALSNGLMISIGSDLLSTMKKKGLDLALVQGSAGYFVPIPATLIIRRDGVIEDIFVDPDFRKRMPPENILASLRGL